MKQIKKSLSLGRYAEADKALPASGSLQTLKAAVGCAVRGYGPVAVSSALVLALSISSAAHAQTATADKNSLVLEEIVVTARRAAIQSAQERKKNAEVMVDSVDADTAGMLPDNSVTEILQRVSGVTMTRFATLSDPDHFSTEGSGVQVRGLSGVAARVNGREVFSANGGGGLSWGDVTPELMAGVDVYKSATAEMIEGGTGGQIDLRTKMPFDYKEGWQLQGSAEMNYGDLSKKLDPSLSMLVSNRWMTPIGEIGALVDVAYSKYDQISNFIRMEPYYRTAVANGSGGYKDVFIPGGFDYGFDGFERTRKGAYVGVQWQPTEDLTIAQTAFYSRYESVGSGSGIQATTSQGSWGYGDWGNGPMYHGGAADGGTNGLGVDPANSQFDANGALVKSGAVFVRDPNTWTPDGVIHAGANTVAFKGNNWTRDLSTSFNWKPLDRLAVKGGVQFVRSESYQRRYDVFPAMDFPGTYSLDLSGDLPQIAFSDTSALSNPANTRWAGHMPSLQDNVGSMHAFNLDAEYTLSEEGFFRSAQVGARHAERSERDASYFGWTDLCQTWDGCNLATHTFASAGGDAELQNFDNFFRGDAHLPSGVWMPSQALVNRLDPVAVDALYGPAGTDATLDAHNSFNALNGDKLREKSINSAAYATLRFAGNIALPFDGNVGVRVVRIENTSSGFYDQKGLFVTDSAGNRIPWTNIPNVADGVLVREGGRTLTRALPNINVRLKPSDQFQIRLAYGITMDQPSFNDLKATGSVGAHIVNNVWDGTFDSNTGNPNLKPMISHNSDVSFEWYPSQSTSAHLALFHKSITDSLIYTTNVKGVSILQNDGNQVTIQANSTETHNSDKEAIVKGLEVGGRTFFDRLPSPWNGFGVEANYTYIDSKSPGDVWYDIDNVFVNGVPTGAHNNAPMRGLSRNSYNIQLMFEKSMFSARLAWSWRSEYLMSTNSNGTNGGYNYLATPNLGAANTPPAVFKDFNLPIYSDDYGQLDFGTTFRPNDHVSISLDFNNLLNEIGKTLMGGYPNAATGAYDQKHVRSWFMSDRRVSLGVRYKF